MSKKISFKSCRFEHISKCRQGCYCDVIDKVGVRYCEVVTTDCSRVDSKDAPMITMALLTKNIRHGGLLSLCLSEFIDKYS